MGILFFYKANRSSRTKGQAIIEYLFLLAFLTGVSLGLFKAISASLDASFGGLGRALSSNLKTSICDNASGTCFFKGYVNE